jgi:hypothetical protein
MEGPGGTWRPRDPLPCQPPRPRSALVRGSVLALPPRSHTSRPGCTVAASSGNTFGDVFGSRHGLDNVAVRMSSLQVKARVVLARTTSGPSNPCSHVLPGERPHEGKRELRSPRCSRDPDRATRAWGEMPRGPTLSVASSPLSFPEQADKYVETLVQAGHTMRIGCWPTGPGRRFVAGRLTRGWFPARSPSVDGRDVRIEGGSPCKQIARAR